MLYAMRVRAAQMLHEAMWAAIFLVFATSAFGETAKAPRVLAIGDSLMAWHSIGGKSIADYLERGLGTKVVNRSIGGAKMLHKLPVSGAMGMSIPAQFRGDWDVVVMTGGGNDLWLGCGCNRCDRRMNRLIAQDGTRGQIPQLMAKILNSGAEVYYVGYLRSPGLGSPIESCKDEGDELEARIARLAERVEGIHYVSNQDLVKPGDRSYFGIDMVHPSVKASREIAGRVLAAMSDGEG